MRCKSVPRHLPRKYCTLQKLLKTKNVTESMEFLSKMKSEGGTVNIKTVNFNNYYDIVKEVDDSSANEENTILPKMIKQEPTLVNVKTEVLDLSKTSNFGKTSETFVPSDDKFKDTYLYQIMTDPDLLKKRISDEKSFIKSQCPHCKKEFNSETEMKDHIYFKPDGKDQLVCCVCGKFFAQKRYLRYHQRCHSERNKYQCDFCSRKYSRLDNLTRHSVFHTNPGKFPCSICDRTFARKDLLNKHLKCHENKYKHYCEICKKYFKGPISLSNHVKLFHPNIESLVINIKSEK